ncbi:MAG: hypothetical protein GTN49_01360 [candidate division Zixibacteria bacterium]|nr:hypothetical protein [candidate division Zixibacteria bacterium]
MVPLRVIGLIMVAGVVASAGFLNPTEAGRVIYRKWDDYNVVTYAKDLATGEETRLYALEKSSGAAVWLLLGFAPDWNTLIFVEYFGGYKDKDSYAAICRLDFGGHRELIFKWDRDPDMGLAAVYDEGENVFYVIRDRLFSEDKHYKYKTSVYLYDPDARRGEKYAEFDNSVLLTGGSFEGEPYARYIDYDPVEEKSSGFFGYIGKADREFHDLGFLLKNGESWFTSTVTGAGYDKSAAPVYFSVVKQYDGIPSRGEYYIVYVRDPNGRDYYRVVLVQWAINREIFYSPKADALVYYSCLEGEESGPKIVVQPVDRGKPTKIFALSSEKAPGCKNPPVYSLVAVE